MMMLMMGMGMERGLVSAEWRWRLGAALGLEGRVTGVAGFEAREEVLELPGEGRGVEVFAALVEAHVAVDIQAAAGLFREARLMRIIGRYADRVAVAGSPSSLV